MSTSVRFAGKTLFRPGVATYIDVSKLNNILLGVQGVVGIVGEASGGEPGVLMVFDNPRDMIAELIDGNLAEMAQALFYPAKDPAIGGAEMVVVSKSNQSTQASIALQDGSSVTQITINAKVWGAPGNFSWAKLSAGVDGGRIFEAGRDTDPLSGQTEELDEISRTTGSPNLDAWIKVWWDRSETTSTHTSATVTYDPNANSLVSTLGGGVIGDSGTLNFTVGNDGILSDHTIETLIATINTKKGWHAELLRPERLRTNARQGDTATTINTYNAAGGAVFWDMMGGVYDLTDKINTKSVFWTATKTVTPPATTQLPANFTKRYGAGGTLGTSSAQDIQDAIALLKKVDVRCVASGYSQDVGGTAIGTINGYLKDHTVDCNAVDNNLERFVYAADGSHTTRATLEAALASLNEVDMGLWAQNVKRENHLGEQEEMDAHVGAAICAGIRAGSPIGTPLTHKFIRANDVTQTGWDPLTKADFQALITRGLLYAEPVTGEGFQISRDLTTYSTLENDALRAGEIRDEMRLLKRVLRTAEKPWVGKKGLGIADAEAAKEAVISALSILSDPGNPDVILVAGTDDNGTPVSPYRNIKITISGDQMYLDGEVTFAQGINFVLNRIFAAPLRAAA